MSPKSPSPRTLAFLILILTACTNKPDPVETIPLFNGPFSKIIVSSLLENAGAYPLATTTDCLVGRNFAFLDCIDGFYILDKSAEKVFRFGARGEFLNTIGQTGKGPGEYVRLYEGIITGNQVELLTGFPHTEILTYSPDGTFLSKRSILEYPSWSFILSPGLDKYFFYGSYFRHKVIGVHRPTGEKADSMLENAEGLVAFGNTTFSLSGKTAVLFCEPVINKLYIITSSGIVEKYRLDFGKFSIGEHPTDEELKKHSGDVGLWVTLKVLENKSFLYLYTAMELPESEPHFQHFLYGKGDKTLWTLPDEDGFSGSLGPAFHLTDKDELYLYLTPSEVVQSKTWQDFFDSRKLSLAADDNPVVISLNIKSIRVR